MIRVVYRLQCCRYDMVPGWGGYLEPQRRESGAYLQANGNDVIVKGYAAALNRCGELNDAIKKEGKWSEGWRFVPVQMTMEEQTNLFDGPHGDQANAPA